jgi:hypothetical protein
MMNSECLGGFSVSQATVDRKIDGSPYDLLITTVSWEERANHALFVLEGAPKATAFFRFESSSDRTSSLKDVVETELLGLFPSAERLNLLPSTETKKNFEKIQKFLSGKRQDARRPLRVAVNMSCLPKAYLLFLLGVFFKSDIAMEADFLYSPGVYDLVVENAVEGPSAPGPRGLLSIGEWKSQQLPFFTGQQVFASEQDLIVTVGGELGMMVPFLERSEPRNIFLLFIAESAPRPDRPMHKLERLAYDDLMMEPNVSTKEVDLVDAIGVAKYALSAAEQSSSVNLVGVAIGSKSHALGLGIAALVHEELEIICRVPAGYSTLNVAPRGDCLIYRVADRFEPLRYL